MPTCEESNKGNATIYKYNVDWSANTAALSSLMTRGGSSMCGGPLAHLQLPNTCPTKKIKKSQREARKIGGN